MSFLADVMGQKVAMDAEPDFGGKGSGARPKPLVLAALAGCSGMDVVSILAKMREPVSWFNMRIEGDLAEEHPKRYTSFRMVYEFKASDGLKAENVQKAVQLSQEKYCGVAGTLRFAGPVEWRIEYV